MKSRSEINRPEKVSVIVNPASGSPYPILRELNAALSNVDWSVEVTRAPGDGALMGKKAVESGAEMVIAYGGDGTLLEVINGMAGSRVPLLVLGGGTGNLIASEIGLPADPAETLALLNHPSLVAETVDLGMINQSTCFILRCGCGLEVSALEKTSYEEKSEWGKLAYIKGMLKALAAQEPIDFNIWIDDAVEPISEKAMAITVANAGRLGVGDLRIAPDVSMSDGYLDICLFQETGLAAAVEFFSLVVDNDSAPADLTGSSLVRRQRARKVRIETGTPVSFQADGDIVGSTPLEIELIPDAVWMVKGLPE